MKTYYPKNTLAEALQAAEPMLAQTALAQAEAGLANIRDECVAHLDGLQAQLESLKGKTEGARERVRSAYELSRQIIGLGQVVGVPQLDDAARGLCDVADGIMHREAADWAPVEAHIDAMRLMRHPSLDQGGVSILLESLNGLRRKFGCAPVPSAG